MTLYRNAVLLSFLVFISPLIKANTLEVHSDTEFKSSKDRISKFLKGQKFSNELSDYITKDIELTSYSKNLRKDDFFLGLVHYKDSRIILEIKEKEIKVSESIRYIPRKQIFCDQVTKLKYTIPCLSKKNKSSSFKLNKEQQDLVRWWKLKQRLYSWFTFSKSKLKSDPEVYTEIMSSSDTTLTQVTIYPLTKIPPVVLKPLVNRPNRRLKKKFVLGFTLHDRIEKEHTARFSIGYLFLSRSYYISGFYKFSYAFGLRVMQELYARTKDVQSRGDTTKGNLIVELRPKDGSVQEFRDVGMNERDLYEGREFLAEVCHENCEAGFKASLPGPDFSKTIRVRHINFLDYLARNSPLRDGHFRPPSPGQSIRLGDIKFDQDLLFDNANLGVVGAKIYPWLRFNMNAKKQAVAVSMPGPDWPQRLGAEICNQQEQKLIFVDAGARQIPFELNNNSNDIVFTKAKYEFDLSVGIGLSLSIWVDLYVYEHTWNIRPYFINNLLRSPNLVLKQHHNTDCGYLLNARR